MRKGERNNLESLVVKYIRLDKGKFARLQPLGSGLGDREVNLKELLERALSVSGFIEL